LHWAVSKGFVSTGRKSCPPHKTDLFGGSNIRANHLHIPDQSAATVPEDFGGSEMTQTFLRIIDVCRVTGLPKAIIYEMIGKGLFPKQVRLSPRAVGWIDSEVRQWQEARIAERDAKVAA
jgi:prophage regulatory protein